MQPGAPLRLRKDSSSPGLPGKGGGGAIQRGEEIRPLTERVEKEAKRKGRRAGHHDGAVCWVCRHPSGSPRLRPIPAKAAGSGTRDNLALRSARAGPQTGADCRTITGISGDVRIHAVVFETGEGKKKKKKDSRAIRGRKTGSQVHLSRQAGRRGKSSDSAEMRTHSRRKGVL